MTRQTLTRGIAVLALIVSLGATMGPAVADGGGAPRGQRLVVAFTGAVPDVERFHGAPVLRVHPDAATLVVQATTDQAARIRDDPDVTHVGPDRPIRVLGTPNDPKYAQQWAPPVVQAPDAWNVTPGAHTVRVAVIDTGIDTDHQDRPAALVLGPDYGDNDGHPEDVHGHGTWVAGILAGARDNGVGTAGLADVETYVIKVFSDSGIGYTSYLDQAIAHAVNAGAHVITMSVGFEADDPLVRNRVQAAANAGVLLVAAAGNEHGGPVLYPAAFPEVIAVSSVDQELAVADHSSVGPEVELAAPGVGIKGPWRGGGYGSTSGTSGAAPHVAAAAAMLWSIAPDLDAATVRDALAATARDLGSPGRDHGTGHGLVQTYDALTAVFDHMPGENVATSAPLTIREGDTIPFHAGGVPIGAHAFAWEADGDDAFDDGTGVRHDWTAFDDGTHHVGFRYSADGTTGGTQRTVTVQNVAPTLHDVSGPAGAAAGRSLTFDVTASDPADALTYRFDWGDGTATAHDAPAATHAWAAPGTYTIRITVDDGDGGTDTATRTVRIGDDGWFAPGSLRVRHDGLLPTGFVQAEHPTRYIVDVDVVLETGGPASDVRVDFVLRRGDTIETFATRTVSTDDAGLRTIHLSVPLDLTGPYMPGEYRVDARLDPRHEWSERVETNNTSTTMVRHLG